jgi:quaternary ammonium compound-resistance protein SugE
MPWVILVVAGLLEVAWSLGLKFTEGFTKPLPSIGTAAAIVGSMLLLAQAARTLPIGTAYAVWVGIGVVGAAVGGVVLFHEAMPPSRLFFLLLLVVAIVGLKLTAPTEPSAISPTTRQGT